MIAVSRRRIASGKTLIMIDGKTVGTSTNSYKQGNFSNKSSSSYTRWSIPNDNYVRIRAWVGCNTANSAGVCMIAFYNGSAWSVPDETFIRYTNTSARWFEADVPANCTSIHVGSRNTATSPSAPTGVIIELYKYV